MDAPDSLKERFNNNLSELIKKKADNCGFLTKEKYNELTNIIKELKNKRSGKTPGDYQRLKRYDIIQVGDMEKLIYPISQANPFIRFYISNDEMFDIIHETHQAIGHGGRNRMMNQLQKNYKNITSEAVMIYINLCEACQKKAKVPKRGLLNNKSLEYNEEVYRSGSCGGRGDIQSTNSLVLTEINSRCQVDLIEMQQDRDFNFILLYKDHLTKFVQLRALRTKQPEEVSSVLLDIFTIFGAPNVLQSDNGRDFSRNIVENLSSKWNELKIVHGQSQGCLERTNQEIKTMLNSWLDINQSCTWSEGLRFVQLMKNMTYDEKLGCTPYESMFGSSIKIGLKTSCLPDEALKNLRSEEELEKVLMKM